MTQLEFAQTSWIHAIWGVLALAVVIVALELRGRSVLDNMVSRLMQRRLVTRASLTRRLVSLALLVAALAALVLALMRPQWGIRVQKLTRVDSQVMVCLDVSRSMLAEDVAPNRLDRAKAELDSLLGLMDEGQQAGLIAFAGKATVLCPMTTDFGFLRLVLNDAVPQSVGLGGTKIGEALQKAIDGFGEAGDIHRVILMITDGEDHDSFPLDAAKRARERGIRVVSIGFGDETGSKIEVTDPQTGTRSFVKDRNGQDVLSRLDGEMLRNIAMETEGVYVPAGTGALDLESIYERHIDTLLRGSVSDQQQVLRNEAYQWCVLLALILMSCGLAVASPWALKTQAIQRASLLSPGPNSTAVWLLLGLAVSMTVSDIGWARAPQVETPETAEREPGDAEGNAGTETEQEEGRNPRTPRGAYNDALAFLKTDADRAERLLEQARREAKADGEVRFRSLYNLGWVEVHRADALMNENPQAALQHLEAAVHRFREAIRLRPESRDARHNLEVLARRVLELSDSLNQQDGTDIAARLDALLDRQRGSQSELASLVQAMDGASDQVEQHRASFRRAAITQRQVISDLQKLSDDVRKQQVALQEKKDEERSDEERVRAMQLGGVSRFVETALQRLQKARALTRRVQGSRAFHRWSAGLSDTKRARDQLRNPIEILGAIAADAEPLAQLTRRSVLADSLAESEPEPLPAWVSQEYLHESQQAIGERSTEVTQALSAAVANRGAAEGDADPSETMSDEQKQAKALMENIQQALPLLESASEAFREAAAELEQNRQETANEKQWEGLTALHDAMEYFLDLRRLIERIYSEQRQVQAALRVVEQEPEAAAMLARTGVERLEKNAARLVRLNKMLDDELAKLEESASSPPGTDPSAEPQENPEETRLELAKQLVSEVSAKTQSQSRNLTAAADAGDDDSQATVFASASEAAEASVQRLEELRRLFFSLIEHLRDTGRRQAELRDDTGELAGQVERQTPDAIGPLAVRQQGLQQMAEQIADGLRQQAQAPPTSPPGNSTDPGMSTEIQERLLEAGGLVDDARYEMMMSAQAMETLADAEDRDFTETTQRQTTALEKIAEALRLLDDSQQNEQPDQQQQQQNQQDQQQDEQQEQEQDQQQQQQNMDASQLLQLIRDREAQRRKDRQQRAYRGGGAEKDW